MEQKNRLVIVVAIVALIVGAIFASFGRVLFAAHTPEVILPSGSAGTGDLPGSVSQEQNYQRVEVTTDTVQGVVATLVRPSSYYRTLNVETFWPGGSSAAPQAVSSRARTTQNRTKFFRYLFMAGFSFRNTENSVRFLPAALRPVPAGSS